MAKRKIVWTQTAARQRRNILEYWVDRNKSNSYSLKLLKASNSKTELIAKNPWPGAQKFSEKLIFQKHVSLQWDTSAFSISSIPKKLLLQHSGTIGKTHKNFWKY